MRFVLLAALIGVPLIEIALFIQVGGFIGVWPTIAVVVLTALAGTALLRHQGLGALARLQDSLDRGEPPLDPVFDGFCVLVAGILLLTPGFFTDALGFVLFMAPFRRVLKQMVARRVHVKTQAHGQTGARTHDRGPGPGGPRDSVIEGDFQDITEPDPPTPQNPHGPH